MKARLRPSDYLYIGVALMLIMLNAASMEAILQLIVSHNLYEGTLALWILHLLRIDMAIAIAAAVLSIVARLISTPKWYWLFVSSCIVMVLNPPFGTLIGAFGLIAIRKNYREALSK